MIQNVGGLADMVLVLFYNGVVVIDAVCQQMLVGRQVTINKANRTPVYVEPYTNSAFVALEQKSQEWTLIEEYRLYVMKIGFIPPFCKGKNVGHGMKENIM